MCEHVLDVCGTLRGQFWKSLGTCLGYVQKTCNAVDKASFYQVQIASNLFAFILDGQMNRGGKAHLSALLPRQ